jgi:hypothetical protein
MTPISDGGACSGSDDSFIDFTEAELRDMERRSTEFESGPLPQAEIDELLAGLDDSPDADSVPNDKRELFLPRWTEDLRAFQGRHGPFTAPEIVRIIQELNKSE